MMLGAALTAVVLRAAAADPVDPRMADLAAPATPLIANDPYFQTYLPRGNLTDNPTVAGTNGQEQQISAIAFIEGHVCQLIGPPEKGATAAAQLSVVVYPTRTVYELMCGEAWALQTPFTVTFMTAQLPSNVTLMARPVSYITFYSKPGAGSSNVQVYVDVTYQASTSPPKQGDPVKIACGTNMTQMGVYTGWLGNAATQSTPIPCASPPGACRNGDNINWGQLYLAQDGNPVAVGAADDMRSKFVSAGTLKDSDACTSTLSGDSMPVLATVFDLNNQNDPGAPISVVLGYDQDVAIRWWGTDFPGLWTQESATAQEMMAVAVADTDYVATLCQKFDNAEVDKYTKIGGPKFATILSLAYRQAYSSTKLTWNTEKKTHWQFLKEISTGSDLSTMDVIYPGSPLYIYQAPDLAYNLLISTLEYANNATNVSYNLAWCPHHLGKYPVGYILPNQQEQMPVEETANMHLMLAAIAQQKGNSTDFIDNKYWPLLKIWADYLVSTTYDPATQLCTDDFMGRSAHNANLAIKGVIALGAYAQLMEFKGDTVSATKYRKIAENYTSYWQSHAKSSDGSHYKLAYDMDDSTWSQKYNLVWDKILKLNLIPQDVFDAEVAFYSKNFEQYGLRLDNRKDLTKTDWFMWTGAFGSDAYFKQVVDSVFDQLGADNTDKPLTDCYNTTTAQGWFRDRAVVGAFWAKLLIEGEKPPTL